MKLFYYNGKSKGIASNNFGDELNPWIWDRLLPGRFDNDGRSLFVGIGTLLNEHLPQLPQKYIFGSGVGYGETPRVDHSWNIYFVRGKLSAKALEIAPSLALTDPAILVPQFFQPTGQKKYQRSYLPHFTEAMANGAVWKELCQNLGIHYIDPTLTPDQVLAEIDATEVLFTEAMHGEIVADAIRVPWVAVKTKEDILDFKWNDWLSTVNLSYSPFTIQRFASRLGKDGVLRYCDYQWIRAQMTYLKQVAKPQLSSASKQDELTEKVILKLEQFKLDQLHAENHHASQS